MGEEYGVFIGEKKLRALQAVLKSSVCSVLLGCKSGTIYLAVQRL
jgi:hypothetical protein